MHGFDILIVFLILKSQRKDAHSDEVSPMGRGDAFSNNRLHSKQGGSFSGPIMSRPTSVILAYNEDELAAGLLIRDGGIEDESRLGIFCRFDVLIRRGHRTIAKVLGVASLNSSAHVVPKVTAVKGATGHDVDVLASFFERVQLVLIDPVFKKVFPSWGGRSNYSDGCDLIGRDTVTKDSEWAGVEEVSSFRPSLTPALGKDDGK